MKQFLSLGMFTASCAISSAWCTQLIGDEVQFARDVQPILTKYCVGCHNDQEHEAGVRLNRWSSILRGGDDGKIVIAHDAEHSVMMQLIRSTEEPKMPPKDEPQPSEKEVAILAQWIEQGAQGNDATLPLKERLAIKPNSPSPLQNASITALDITRDGSFWFGKYDRLEMRRAGTTAPLPYDIVGKVAQIRTTADGRFTVIASGIPGVGGQATLIQHVDGSKLPTVLRTIEAHNDTLYCAVLSPDGTLLATAGYDRKILLWNTADGSLIRKLEGHNGAVYDLDFDATGQVLASASADETIKIWRVATGERLDTFGQCEAEQYAVRFDSTRNRVLAVGADRRIRAWKLISTEKASICPMLYATFAHEASVSLLALSPDNQWIATAGEDKQIKLWNAEDLSPIGILASLPDAPSGLHWSSDGATLYATALNGEWKTMETQSLLNRAAVRDVPLQPQSLDNDSGASITAILTESNTTRSIETAQWLPIPCEVSGSLSSEDMHGEHYGDWYAFDAKAGETWIVSIQAAQSGSPLDSLLDVLDSKGQPILRTRLQAVRETYFTFQGKGSVSPDDFRLHRWEDMELNEYLYAGGEVVKLWLYPRGPDSGFKVYPGVGTRFTYFDTTATTHALNEPAWIVRELAENETPVPNGLPLLPVYHSNDDAGHRKSGKDSEILFTCKQDGRYLVRLRDARGQSGDTYQYKLSIRKPAPRFTARAEQNEITLRRGVGTEFGIVAEHFDGFEGNIDITAAGLPEGLRFASPLTIQAGQLRAIGNVFFPDDVAATLPADFSMTLRATALVHGKPVSVDFPQPVKVVVKNEPAMKSRMIAKDQPETAAPLATLVIHPGETISAHLVIERGGNAGDIAFGGDDSGRNMPHGCYVDNIGLNGLLIPAGQNVREVFITAAPWVPPQERYVHLRAQVDGNPTTLPVLLRVEPLRKD